MLWRFWEDAFLGLNAEELALPAKGDRFGVRSVCSLQWHRLGCDGLKSFGGETIPFRLEFHAKLHA
jgi:hypothetical protein